MERVEEAVVPDPVLKHEVADDPDCVCGDDETSKAEHVRLTRVLKDGVEVWKKFRVEDAEKRFPDGEEGEDEDHRGTCKDHTARVKKGTGRKFKREE